MSLTLIIMSHVNRIIRNSCVAASKGTLILLVLEFKSAPPFFLTCINVLLGPNSVHLKSLCKSAPSLFITCMTMRHWKVFLLMEELCGATNIHLHSRRDTFQREGNDLRQGFIPLWYGRYLQQPSLSIDQS